MGYDTYDHARLLDMREKINHAMAKLGIHQDNAGPNYGPAHAGGSGMHHHAGTVTPRNLTWPRMSNENVNPGVPLPWGSENMSAPNFPVPPPPILAGGGSIQTTTMQAPTNQWTMWSSANRNPSHSPFHF